MRNGEGRSLGIGGILLSALLLFQLFHGSAANAAMPSEIKQQAINDAFASCFTQIFEDQAGVPASGIGEMAGYFSAGDYSDGLLKLAELASDQLIGQIPVIGPLKFAAGLETAVLNAGKAYLDGYMVDLFWNKFKTLDPQLQQAWVNGQYVAEMDAAVGGYYTERNVADIRELFGFYLDQENARNAYMEKAAEVTEDLYKAKYFSAPELIRPVGAQMKYNSSITLEWWAFGANYFKVNLNVNGEGYSVTKKVNPYTNTVSVELGEFGIDWDRIFNEASGPVQVTWSVQSARYDSSGLVKSLVGEHYVVGNNDLISLPGFDPVKQSEIGSFVVTSPEMFQVTIQSPTSGTITTDNSVTVTAYLASAAGASLSTVAAVGFVINGSVQYASLNANTFSTVAVLATGDNEIKAGLVTTDGMVVLSDPVHVTSQAQNNTYHIRISWDKDDTDVDLHFSWSGGAECYYGNERPNWGGADVSPALDVDNTQGYGPENITIERLPGPGHYKIWVHYFSDHGNGGTTVHATIDENGKTIFSSTRYMNDEEDWTLYEFDI